MQVEFVADTTSNLKNPYMGWTLYTESRSNHTDGEQYWRTQNEAAEKYAGVFYLRWKWNEIEPEEGEYAWDNDPIFKNLIQGALDRNLRLAFRIFTHTGTPQYVLDSAETYEIWGKQTPYADDEFFLEKYTKFIAAFGAEFNNPATVDYVDAYGMGWWGEGHNIKYKDKSKKYESHNRIVKAYALAFDKVINVINFGVRDEKQKKMVYDSLHFTPRRDGYASKWFPTKDQEALKAHFPNSPIIAEACYWGDHDISYHIEHEDGKKQWDTWQEYYKDVVDLALETHANYLDLRTINETKRYVEDAPKQIQKFISHGGYRILPTTIVYTKHNNKINIEHAWQNIGVGVLPNNKLGFKYKVAFAIFDKDNNMIQHWTSNKIEVSELINKRRIKVEDSFIYNEKQYHTSYKLAVAIVNTCDKDSKNINLAVKVAEKIAGEWVVVGSAMQTL